MKRQSSSHSASKRLRVDPGILLKRLLLAVTEENVLKLVGALDREQGRTFVSTLVACVEGFPTKTMTYALLVGVMATKPMLREWVMRTLVVCAGRIHGGITRAERLCVRFLAAAVKTLGLPSEMMFGVLDALVGKEEDGEMSRFREAQLFSALSAVPWFTCSSAAARATEEEEQSANARWNAIRLRLQGVRRVKALPARLASLPRAQQDRTNLACDRLAMGLAVATQEDRLSMQNIEFDSLLITSSPHLPQFNELEFEPVHEAFVALQQRILASSAADQTSTSSVPSAKEHEFSSTLLPLFPNGEPEDPTSLQEVRRPTLMERFLTREHVLDVLSAFAPKSSEAAEQLLNLNIPHVAVESVFSAMLQMPEPEYTPLYYADVLVKMCRKAPTTVPAAIEDALDRILELEPESMDPDVVDRLSLWLVSHLFAFDLDWPWVKWQNVLELDSKQSVRALVEQVLDKLDALFDSREQMEKAIPKELMSRFLEKTPDGVSSNLGSPLFEDVIALLKSKPSAEELEALLEERAPKAEWTVMARIQLIVEASLFSGKISFTHARAALDRAASALASSQDDDEELIVAKAALQAAVSFWRAAPSCAVFAISAIVDSGIATPAFTLKWLAESSLRENDEVATLAPHWQRRSMEDVLARIPVWEEKLTAIDAASRDTDELTDLWLSRRRRA